jgi:hypothetical protein
MCLCPRDVSQANRRPESRWQVGRIYKELTGVPENLTQVIFIEVKHGSYFVGGVRSAWRAISARGAA